MIKKMLAACVVTLASASAMAAIATNAAVAPTEAMAVSTTAAAVEAKPKKVTATFVAESTIGAAVANRGNWEGNADSSQHIGLAYKLNEDQSVQYRQYFYYNATDAKRTDEYALGEHMFRFSDASAMTIGDATVANDYRVYLPGSEFVRDIGQYQIRMDNAIEQVVGKATISYGVSSRAFAYSGNGDGQMGFRVLPTVGVEYQANKILTPHVSVNTDHRWYHNGRGIATLGPKAGKVADPAANSDVMNTDLGSKIAINKNVSVDVYLETETDLHNGGKYDLFNDQTNTYMLDLSVSM